MSVKKNGDKDLVPPDGGYGWIVTLAYALNNVVVLPMISGFGLIFQEAFEQTGVTATQASLIINLNHGFGMLLSFFGGPLLKRFGYRKVATAGSLFVAFGVMLTSCANGFWMFIFAYSIMTSIGIAAVMAAFTLAINSFFKEKRGRAIGLGMSITGLGPILMPLLMNALMYAYGWKSAVLVLGGLCLHSFVGSLLLRPAKWYLVKAKVEAIEEIIPLNPRQQSLEIIEERNDVTPPLTNGSALGVRTSDYISDVEEDVKKTPKSMSMHSLNSTTSLHSRNAISHPDVRKPKLEQPSMVPAYKWWESQEVNLGSSVNIFNETDKRIEAEKFEDKDGKKTFAMKIVDFFDLTLLKDPIFVNILVGLSIAACAEINFSLLLPLILKDMTFQTNEIAFLMAIIGGSDLVFRLVSPFIGDWCHKPPRVMYLASLLMIIFTRTTMLFATTFSAMCYVALGIGVTKGIRTVYMNIVIPSYVPLERLPFASGIQMFVNGVILIIFGPLLGLLKDQSGSYRLPIILINLVTFITVILWSIEFLHVKRTKPKEDTPV